MKSTPTPFRFATFAVFAVLALLPAALVRADDMAAKLSGTWKGDFINSTGNRYPVTFVITASDGKLSGKGDIPDSSIDTSPSVTGAYGGGKSRWELSSGFIYDLKLSESSSTLRLEGNVSGANNGELEISRPAGHSAAPAGDPYEQAYEFMKQVTDERCECFIKKYAPAQGMKAYALSKDGAYGGKWSDSGRDLSLDDVREGALASCRKKPNYKPENPCVVFMENDTIVYKR